MNRIFCATIFWLSVSATAFTQTAIFNGSMEDWENVGTDTEEPLQWNSNKTGGGNATTGPKTLNRDTSTLNGGTYCAKITSRSSLATFGVVVNGSLTTGRIEAPTIQKSEGYIRTIPTNAPFRMPFTGRPDSIVFWIRYAPQGADYARVEFRLHVGHAYAPEAPVNNNHPDSTQNIIARALWNNSSASNKAIPNWTRISLPFQYVDNRTPQFILVTSTSSGEQTGGVNNSAMWLDEFTVIYNPTIAVGAVNQGPYYVSAAAGTGISVPFTLTGTYNPGNTITAQLSDASGNFAQPVNLGSLATLSSGTINGTIPAGTPSGTGYKVRVQSGSPMLTSAAITNNVEVVLVSSSVAPAAVQNLAANTNGSLLTANTTAGFTSREWKFSTTSGSGYQSFTPAQTSATYIPNFATAGTYYVVCETTYPGGLTTRTNEVQVNVVSSAINPSSPQSLLINAPGAQLTVTETPAGTSREWKFSTTQGSGYQSFTPAQTGPTYTPQFASAGTYYVVCESQINGVSARSNEVIVSVNSVSLQTTSVTDFPIDFSPNAPNKNVTVNFTVSGGTFAGGNIFTAQLSNAAGSFASPVNIGSVSGTGSGSINATVANTTPGGSGYRVRVVGSNPNVLGADNGADLFIDQFSNSIGSAAKQTIQYNTSGNFLTVTESQNTTSRTWKFGASAAGPFQPFTPNVSTPSYTPSFPLPGTYFVVCVSKNVYGDSATSNAVEIEVTNGTQLSTTTVTGSPFLISPKATAQGSVSFSSDIIFEPNNVFNVELSNATGGFANPIVVGTQTGSSISPIAVTIPNNIVGGTGYRLRVVSTSPAATGTPSASVSVVPFANSISPADTQQAVVNVPSTLLTVSETHTAVSREWFVSFFEGAFFNSFNPRETGNTLSPVFLGPGTAYVICKSVNAASDTITSAAVVFLVEEPNSIHEPNAVAAKAWFAGSELMVEVSRSFVDGELMVAAANGSTVIEKHILQNNLNTIPFNLASGVYLVQLQSKSGVVKHFKIVKP